MFDEQWPPDRMPFSPFESFPEQQIEPLSPAPLLFRSLLFLKSLPMFHQRSEVKEGPPSEEEQSHNRGQRRCPQRRQSRHQRSVPIRPKDLVIDPEDAWKKWGG